ncbi:Protein HIGH CHLOROPHYLL FLUORESCENCE PHENOTYPE 173, chloroplastic, partial [Linum perenne]
RKFSGLGQISRTTRPDETAAALDALLIREGPMSADDDAKQQRRSSKGRRRLTSGGGVARECGGFTQQK